MRNKIICDICGKEVGKNKFVTCTEHQFGKMIGLHRSKDFDICNKCVDTIREKINKANNERGE